MNIVLDIDNVIFNNAKAYFDFVYKRTGHKYDYNDMKIWSYFNIMPDIENEKALALLIEMHSSEDLERMPLIKGALDTIIKFKKQGHKISLVSSCLPSDAMEKSKEIRMKHLDEIFGKDFFNAVHLLPMDSKSSANGNKKDILRLYVGKDTFYLDDSRTNYDDGVEVGIENSFLFSAPWNNGEKNVKRVEGWEDFYKKVEAHNNHNFFPDANKLQIEGLNINS